MTVRPSSPSVRLLLATATTGLLHAGTLAQRWCSKAMGSPGRSLSLLPSRDAIGWPVTGGDAGHMRYSPLTDVHRGNVAHLKVAWTYRHGDYRQPIGPDKVLRGTAFEATPIVVEGRLIFTTPFNRVIALDPETGVELWTFDPKIDKGRHRDTEKP